MQFSSNCSCPLLHRSDYSCRPIFSVLSSLLIYLSFFPYRVTIFSICLLDWLHSRRQIIRYYDKTICERDATKCITTRCTWQNVQRTRVRCISSLQMIARWWIAWRIAKIRVAELSNEKLVYFFDRRLFFTTRWSSLRDSHARWDNEIREIYVGRKTRRQKLQEYRTIENRKKKIEKERERNRKSKRLVTTSSRAQSSRG